MADGPRRTLYERLIAAPAAPPAKRARVAHTADDLRATVRAMRLLYTQGQLAKMKKADLEALVGTNPIVRAVPAVRPPRVELDAAQKRFLEGTWTRAILHAGPGSGKTTTLCHGAGLWKALRVLFLTYTNAGVGAIKGRLRALGHSCNRSKITGGASGVYVVTFNSYAANRARTGAGTFGDPESTSSFDDALMRHTHLGVQPEWERWDVVLVDEAQDVVRLHEKLLTQIQTVATRFALAGDPRQELYPGARFFTQACLSGAYEMHYLETNYRSSPGIIKMLNAFSEAHFPAGIHAPQSAPTGGPAEHETAPALRLVVTPAPRALYTEAAHILAAVSDGALISPVTVERFNTAPLCLGVQQVLHAEHGRIAKVTGNKAAAARLPGDLTVVMGNACAVKGLEYEETVVVQSDIPYEDYGVSREAYTRSLYVALSRARSRVTLLFTGPPQHPLLGVLCRLTGLQEGYSSPAPQRKLRREFNVTRDFCGRCALGATSTLVTTLPALAVESRECPAYLGVYVEKLLAQRMGAPLPRTVEITKYERGSRPGMHILPGEAQILVIRPYAQALAPELAALREPGGLNWPALAKVEYSLAIGQTWTLGDTLVPGDDPAYEALDAFRDYLGPATASSVQRVYAIRGHRSPLELGWLEGITDIEGPETLLEIKHAVHSDVHLVQTAVYREMAAEAGTPKRALLVNTKTGEIGEVVPGPGFALFARALLAMNQALQCRQERCLYAFETEPLVVAVDIENTRDGSVFEVGAVAFVRGSNTLVSVFHEVARGAVNLREPKPVIEGEFDVEDLCGLSLGGVASLSEESARLVEAFAAWTSALPPHTVLKWGGSDEALLGGAPMEDMLMRYRAHLQLVGCPSAGASLSDAVDALSACCEAGGPIFVPHRAYEDALALMFVFVVLSA